MTIRGSLFSVAGLGAALSLGWVGLPAVLYTSAQQPLDFNHRVHKEKGSMACADCHAIRDDGSFAGVPTLENCAGCHSEPMGTTAVEKALVEKYVKPSREVGWLVYSRQPMNVRFSHAIHVNRAKMKCEECHSKHGETEKLRVYQENRISGYSRDIWGSKMLRVGLKPGEGMKMTDCEDCHAKKGVDAGCLGCHR